MLEHRGTWCASAGVGVVGCGNAYILVSGGKTGVATPGELFGIYPEGTRSPDGRLYRGKTGVARLALVSGAPVIPVAMIGMHNAQPVGQLLPSRTDIGIVIGKPLDFSRYWGLSRDRYVLRAITDEIMYNLMLLSGQEYVDLYAADVKAKLAAEGKFDGPVPSNAHAAPGGRTAPDVEVPQAPAPEETGESTPEAPDADEGATAPGGDDAGGAA